MGRAFCSSCGWLQLTHILRWNHTIPTDCFCCGGGGLDGWGRKWETDMQMYYLGDIKHSFVLPSSCWMVVGEDKEGMLEKYRNFYLHTYLGETLAIHGIFHYKPSSIYMYEYLQGHGIRIYECIFMVEPTNYPFPYFPFTLNGFPCTTFVLTQYYYTGIVPKWVGIAWKSAQVDACVCKVHLHVVHVLVVCRPI